LDGRWPDHRLTGDVFEDPGQMLTELRALLA
jgi:hypothetical protein